MRWVAVLALVGCAHAPTFVASDGGPLQCRRVCPPGQMLEPVTEGAPDVRSLNDCCSQADRPSLTWSSCAWNYHVQTGWTP